MAEKNTPSTHQSSSGGSSVDERTSHSHDSPYSSQGLSGTSPSSSYTRYTHGHSSATIANHSTRSAHDSCAYFLDHLTENDNLLDIGCGPGSITSDLSRLVRLAHGVDMDQRVIDAAKESYSSSTCSFSVGSIDDLAHSRRCESQSSESDASEAESESLDAHCHNVWDVVHAHQVLQHLQDPVGALKIMGGLVRPGGIIAVRDADYSKFFTGPDDEALSLWKDTYRTCAYNNGAHPDAGSQLKTWALEAGFKAEQIT